MKHKINKFIRVIYFIWLILLSGSINNTAFGCATNKCNSADLEEIIGSYTIPVNTSLPPTTPRVIFSGSTANFYIAQQGQIGTGTIVAKGGPTITIAYTPDTNACGYDCFIIKDPTDAFTILGVQIAVVQNFVANPSTVVACFNIQVTSSVTSSGGLPGDTITYSLVSGPSHGTLITGINSSSGVFTYNPNVNFIGQDSFVFRANDTTSGQSSTATVTVIVDSPLSGNPTTITACEGNAFVGQFSVTGGVGPYSYAVISPTQRGATLTQPGGSNSPIYTYTANFTGTDAINFFAADSLGCSFGLANPGTVNVNVTPALVAGPVSFSVCNNASSAQLFNVTGGQSGSYTFNIPSSGSGAPTKGTAVVNGNGTFTYTPSAGTSGTDSFSYFFGDGTCAATSGTITANIERAPLLQFLPNISLCENSNATEIVSNIPPGTLTPSIVSSPSHGTITFEPFSSGFEYIYSPTVGYVGPDSFIFAAQNPFLNACVATGGVNISVLSLPVANSFTITGCANNQISSLLRPSGGSGSYSGYVVQTRSANGGSIAPNTVYPHFLYTPPANFVGTDSFTYSVIDSNGCQSANGTVTINVTPALIASNLSFTGCLGSNVNGQLSATGGSGNYRFTIPNQPPEISHFNLNTGSFVWNFSNTSTVTFNYTVQDVTLGCISGTASVQMIPLSSTLPQVSPISFSVSEGGSYSSTLVVNNPVGGHTYNFTYSNGPNHGVLNPFNTISGAFSYNATAGYVGSDNFSYKAIDTTVGCAGALANASITVTSTLAPTVPNISLSGCLNGTINGTLTATGGTPPYTFSFFNGPSHGTLPVFNSATGQFNYQSTSGFTGQDSFNYVATDSIGSQSNVGTVSITIGSNTAPMAGPVTVTSCQNGQVSGLFNVAGGTLPYSNYTIVVAPTIGQVSNINVTAGTFIYTPNPNVVGSDSFSYTVTDANGCTSNTAVASVTINSTAAPTAQNASYTVCENGMINGLFNSTGLVGPFNVITLPSNGTLTHVGTSQNFTYTPNTNFVGTDSFTFTVTSGSCVSSAGTITLNVIAFSAPTITSPLLLTSCENGVVSASVNPVGGTSPYFTFIQQQPAHGSATGSNGFSTNPSVTYIPNFNFVGADSFIYAVQDSSSPTNCFSLTGLATVNVLSTPAPSVSPVNLVSCQGDAVTGNFTASGGTLPYNYTYSNGPSNGTITAFNSTTGQITYQPNLGYSGPDSLVYKVSDANACQSFTAAVGIFVDSNITANPLSISMCMGTSDQSQLTANGGTPPYSYSYFLPGPSHGTFTQFDQATGQFTYKPATNYSGPDNFTFLITDEVGCSTSPASVNITVNPVVTALPFSLSVCGGGSTNGTFQAVGGSGTYTFNYTNPPAVPPSHGFITQTGTNTFTYTPVNGYVGSDSFMYTATDVTTGCASMPALVSIVVSGSSPSVLPASLGVCFNTSTPGQLTASGGTPPYTFSFFNGPSNGTLSPFDAATGIFVYNPNAGFSGEDTFSYVATDSLGCASAAATFVISVNSQIVSSPVSLTTCENSCKQGTFNTTGGSGSFIYNITGTGPSNGQVFVGAGNTFTYCPNSGFTGTDSFNYYAQDLLHCNCVSNIASVSVTVETSPTATPENLTGCLGSSITSQFIATGGSGSYTFTNTNPQKGNLTLGSNGIFTYQPIVSNFSGADSFTYTATDTVTSCVSSPATVNLFINTTPSPVAQRVGITGCQGVSIPGIYSPTSGSGTYTRFNVITGPSHGIVSPTGSSSLAFTYTSNATYVGSDSFTYTVQDSNNCVSSLGTVSVAIDQPIANNQTITTSANHSKTGTLSVSGGIGSLTYAVNPPSVVGASVTLTGGPSSPVFLYTPAPNFTGTDTFTFTATDSFCVSNLGTVTVQVISLIANNVNLSVCENESGQAVLSGTGGLGCYTYNVPSTSVSGGRIVQPYGNCASQIMYTPPANFTGTDTFTYTVTDALDDQSSVGTATIQVRTLPLPSTITLSTCQNFAANGNFTATGGSSANYLFGITGSGPIHGTVELSIVTPLFTYNPTTGFAGSDSFTYTATDTAGCIGTGQVNVTVLGAPTANQVTIPACMNAVFQGNLLPSGGTSPYVLTVPTFSNQGGVIKQPSGNTSTQFTYLSPLNYIGPDSFNYTVTDANGCTGAAGTVSITVDAARAISASLRGCANTSFSSILSGVGGIGAYNFTYSNGPFDGTLNPFNPSTGAFTYNPTAGFVGSDSFNFNIIDQNGQGCLSNPATISITVDGITVSNESFDVCANGTLVSQLTAQGGIGTIIFTKVGSGPVPGNFLSVSSSGLFTYSPTAGFVGNDGFFYVATDSLNCNSNIGQVSILVEQPTADSQNFSACQASTTNGVLTAVGGIGNLTYIVPTVSAQGGTIVNSGSDLFTYTPPTSSYTGPDSFSYSVQDSLGCVSNPATVSITVGSPVVSNLHLGVCVSGELVGQLIATGGTGIYNYQVIASPTNGVFSSFCATTGVFVYVPNAEFMGTDSFTYKVIDSNLCTSNLGTVSIAVEAPIADPLNISMCPNTSALLNLAAGSTGGTGIYTNYAIVAGPEKGVLIPVSASGGQFLYTPFVGYNGVDNFLYTVTDSDGCVSAPGPVNIVLAQLLGTNLLAVDCVNSLLTGQASATGGSGIYTFGPIVINPAHGTASINATGIFNYTPTLNFTGSDNFTYKVTDSFGCNSLASVFITVGRPVAINQNVTGCSNASNFGSLSASQGLSPYVFSINSVPSHGTVSILNSSSGLFVYNPVTGYVGPDSFSFIVTDSVHCQSLPGTVSINVINNAVAQPVSFTSCEGVFVTGTVMATGGSGSFISYQVVTPPAHGTLLSFCTDDGEFVYNPTGGFTGIDSFTYSVTDTQSCTSAPGTVSITVGPAPMGLPVVIDLCSTSGTVTDNLNPTGGSGDYVQYIVPSTSFEGGTVTQPMGDTSPEFTYVSPSGLSGADGFNYQVLDSDGCLSTPGSVVIQVNSGAFGIGVNAQDVAGQTITGQLEGAGGVPPYTFALVTPPFQGVATVSSSGFWSYTANQTASGTDFFTFSVTDSSGCVMRSIITRAPAPDNTVVITIIAAGSGYPFDIIGDTCPLT